MPTSSIRNARSDLIPLDYSPLAEENLADMPPARKPVIQSNLVVRVGVSGHRDLPLEETERLERETREVLRQIARITKDIFDHRREAGFEVYSDEPYELRMISPLAEGADRLVARQALLEEYRLQCPLPFPKVEYAADFQEKPGHPEDTTEEFLMLLQHANDDILELDGVRPSEKDEYKEKEAYEAVGRLVLRQCDVLIAIWDPEREEKVGGTRQIVRESLSLEIPTVWISMRQRIEPRLLLSIDPLKSEALDLLDERLRGMFIFEIREMPPCPGENDEQEKREERREREITAAKRFALEEPPDQDFGFLFRVFRDAWCWTPGKKKSARPAVTSDWRLAFMRNQDFGKRIESNYNWADCLANHYGGLYRSSFVATYCMGALAVLVAFLGFYFEQSGWRFFFFALELLIIIAIFLITWAGRREGWHQRWMDYRLFAESLRQLQFLAPLGRITLSFKVPAHLQPSDPRNSWFNWYFRALVRAGGMVRGTFDPTYLQLCKRALEDAIQRQVYYHLDNHETLRIFSRQLHRAAQASFALAALACVLHIQHWAHGTVMSLAVNLATIVLPAFGAALAAISHHGEFERLALRSEALAERLAHLRDELQQQELQSKELARAAEAFSEVMFGELLDWRFAFLEKNLELP